MKLISIETQIIKATIDALLKDGYLLSVNDSEEITISRSADPDAIFAAMKTSDEDFLMTHRRPPAQARVSAVGAGWVRFIYGNDDTEVINDYTVNLEPVMAPIFDMITEYEDGYI